MLARLSLVLALSTVLALLAPPRPVAADAPKHEAVAVEGIAGSLVKPDGATVAVLILPGSGPTDRNGNSAFGLTTDAYKHLAEGLAKAGIASLRYDKRGLAASRNRADGTPVTEESLTIETSAADAATLVGFLAKQAGITRVALVGHSEGGLVALLAARRAEVDRIVLVTAAGFPLGQVLRKQFARQPIPEETMAGIERAIAAIEAGKEVGQLLPPLDQLFRASVQPFLRSVLTLDPTTLVKETKRPLLVIGGGNDLQIGRFDFDALRGAKEGVQSLWLTQLTHTLKAADPQDESQRKAYTDPAIPVLPELIEKLAEFVKG